MTLGHLLLALLPLIQTVVAQTSTAFHDSENGFNFQAFTDPVHSVTYAAVFPPLVTTGAQPTEFIGEFISPIVNKWVSLSLGGSMISSLSLLAWPNNNDIVTSPRYATDYTQPLVYNGPTLTTLPSSHINSTHWKWVFRCQNCTSWQGGSLNTNSAVVWAWALSTVGVDTPSSANSTFLEHTDFGFWGQNTANAHDADYSNYLNGQGGPQRS